MLVRYSDVSFKDATFTALSLKIFFSIFLIRYEVPISFYGYFKSHFANLAKLLKANCWICIHVSKMYHLLKINLIHKGSLSWLYFRYSQMFIFCICLFTLVLFTFRLLVYGLFEYTSSLDSRLNCKTIVFFVFIHIFSVEQSTNMINVMNATISLLLGNNGDGNFDRQNWSKPLSAPQSTRQNYHEILISCDGHFCSILNFDGNFEGHGTFHIT